MALGPAARAQTWEPLRGQGDLYQIANLDGRVRGTSASRGTPRSGAPSGTSDFVILLVLALAGLQSGASARPDFYRRAVARALEHAEAGLLSAARFDVSHSRWEDPW